MNIMEVVEKLLVLSVDIFIQSDIVQKSLRQ